MVLGFGEMLEEDRPDESIWLDEPQLIEHFEMRKIARAEKYDSNGSEPEGEYVQNQLADQMLRRVGVK